jgi:hypothetical protein
MDKFAIVEFARTIFDEERDFLYGEPFPADAHVPEKNILPATLDLAKSKKWKRYSGLFILLRQNWTLSLDQHNLIYQTVLPSFTSLVHCPVQT